MTSAQDRRFHEEDAEQLIGALAGIVSAHIVTDGAGRMVEIHVLATPDLHPKQVVRNVESALSAGLGIQVDRRIVSVAQIRSEVSNGAGAGGADPTAAAALVAAAGDGESDTAGSDTAGSDTAPRRAPARTQERLQYVRYEARREDERCTCQVVLRSGEGEVTGTGEGPDTAAGRAESAARAVFDAIGHARRDTRLRLEGAVITSSRGRSFVIVSAHALQDRASIALAGAAAMTRSPEEAAILAALQASNRWSN